MALTDLQKKANRLKITWDEKTTDDELVELIKQEEVKIALEKDQDKIAKENQAKADKAAKEAKIVLKNTRGEDVPEKDYFFPGKDKDGKTVYAKPWFNKECGMPVEDPDIIAVFDKMFDPADNYLLYKVRGKEIYIVIVPLKFAHTIGEHEDSLPGDFQKHSMSFIMEGSVNIDTFKLKLQKIRSYLKKHE